MENWLGCERLLYSIRMDSGRLEGKRKTKKYLEKDSRERAKQSGVEELGGSQSGCTRQKVLVRQRGDLMRQLARWDMMMTHDDDALWNLTLAKKLPVIDKITASCPTNTPPRHYIKRCKQQIELIEKLLVFQVFKNTTAIRFLSFSRSPCPNLYLLCYYTSFSRFEKFFFYVLYSLLWQFFHCFNLINLLNTLSFFKQTAGRNNLISLLLQVIFILQNFFETTPISIASNAVTYRKITTERHVLN